MSLFTRCEQSREEAGARSSAPASRLVPSHRPSSLVPARVFFAYRFPAPLRVVLSPLASRLSSLVSSIHWHPLPAISLPRPVHPPAPAASTPWPRSWLLIGADRYRALRVHSRAWPSRPTPSKRPLAALLHAPVAARLAAHGCTALGPAARSFLLFAPVCPFSPFPGALRPWQRIAWTDASLSITRHGVRLPVLDRVHALLSRTMHSVRHAVLAASHQPSLRAQACTVSPSGALCITSSGRRCAAFSPPPVTSPFPTCLHVPRGLF